MFQNNNSKIVRQLSQKSFMANRSRNLFAIIALILTTFMITSVFSIGFSYAKTNELQQLRMTGTTAHTAITNVSNEQVAQIEQTTTQSTGDGENFISAIGLSHRLGSVDGNGIGDALLGLVWIDEVEWNTHRLPTVTEMKGAYPAVSNEVMLPTWALSKMGITEPKVGMEIKLGYRLTGDNTLQTETFLLSGYYTDYLQIRTGNRGSVYVSAAFRETAGIPLENGSAAMLTFRDSENINAYCKQLKNSIAFGENQSFELVPIYQQDNINLTIVLGVVIAIIITAGYLLIYNILYISISKDIRSYGQLKTLGTTKRQIKRLVRLQVLKISAVGIPVGLLLGAAVSFGIVPLFLNVFSAGKASLGVSISFSPYLFTFAGVFSFLTAAAAGLKPAHIAASISPVEAMKYTGVQGVKRKQRNSSCGTNAARMAWRNICRNRKSTVLVFASLFFGLTLFLLSTGLLGSLSPDNFVSEYLQSDVSVSLQSASMNDALTEKAVREIEEQNGVQSVRTATITAPSIGVPVTYTEETYGNYINSLANNSEIKGGMDFSDPEVIKRYLSYFASYVYGIDSTYAEALKTVDMEAFENGSIILLRKAVDDNGDSLFELGQEIELISEQTGPHTYKIGGFLEENSPGNGERGAAPSIFMSKTALEQLSPENKIGTLDIETDGKNDSAILVQIKNILGNSSEVQITSRYEKEQQIAGYIITCKVMGTGLSMILLLIGVMNFINTMLVSVTTRRQEFAMLESIGMTAKQTKKMLVMEGVYYFFISFALAGTVGSALFAIAFRALSRVAAYAVFTYPIVPLAIAAMVILIACVAAPLAAYEATCRQSLVKRLRVE